MTPLVREKRVVEHVTATTAPALLIGGAADRSWDPEAAAVTGKQVIEIADADHTLYSGHWRTYLRTLEHVTDSVLDFVEGATGAIGMRAQEPSA